MAWGTTPPNRIALKLRAQRPRAQGGGTADKKAGWLGNAILPTRAPDSFKRLLNSTALPKTGEEKGNVRDERPSNGDADKLLIAAPANKERRDACRGQKEVKAKIQGPG